jgi:hypothetical protein
LVFSEEVVKDQLLVLTQPLSIPMDGLSFLEFFQTMDTEPDRDGLVLEYTTDDGASWHDVLDGNGDSILANSDRFIANGYNSVLETGNGNPLPGRAAWSDEVYGPVVVNLEDFVGHLVRFRWRFGCDASVSESGGVGLDDIVLRHVGDCSSSLFVDGFESGDTDAWSRTVP